MNLFSALQAPQRGKLTKQKQVRDITHYLQDKSSFWFNHPYLMIRIMQHLILFQCFYLTFFIMVFDFRIAYQNEPTWVIGLEFLFAILPSVCFSLLIPFTIPIFTIISNIGEMTKYRFMRHVEDESRKKLNNSNSNVSHNSEVDAHAIFHKSIQSTAQPGHHKSVANLFSKLKKNNSNNS